LFVLNLFFLFKKRNEKENNNLLSNILVQEKTNHLVPNHDSIGGCPDHPPSVVVSTTKT
jgi:hypothetical protein